MVIINNTKKQRKMITTDFNNTPEGHPTTTCMLKQMIETFLDFYMSHLCYCTFSLHTNIHVNNQGLLYVNSISEFNKHSSTKLYS